MNSELVIGENSNLNNSGSNSNGSKADSPNMFLVSTFLNGNENYLQWKFSVQIALRAKKKLGFINGTTSRP